MIDTSKLLQKGPSTSESEPCRRLFGAYLITFLRDIVPRYRTRFVNGTLYEEYLRYPIHLLNQEVKTYIFQLACEACEIHPDHVVRHFKKIHGMKASEFDKDWHRRKYPKGGISTVIEVGASGGAQS